MLKNVILKNFLGPDNQQVTAMEIDFWEMGSKSLIISD